jgi:hypothetical protein
MPKKHSKKMIMYFTRSVLLITLLLTFCNKALSADPEKSLIKKPILIPHYNQIYFKKQNPDLNIGEYDRYEELSRKVFIETLNGKSCAVVGSSSNLIGSNYGSFIDSHQIVFRINDAPVEEQYARDIGNKVNVWFITSNKVNPNNLDFKLSPRCDDKFFMIVAHHRELNKSFSKYYNRIVLWRYPEIIALSEGSADRIGELSSGLKAIYYAMSLCQEVNVFGFGADKSGKRAYYHDTNQLFNWDAHQPDEQDKLIQELARQKQINLYMGNAKATNSTKSAEVKKIIPLLHLSHIIKKDIAYVKNPTENKKNFINTIDGKSCAVVGASSNLTNSDYGEFIDDHDVVFRVNDHRVKRVYQKDIGKKTTVRFINSPHKDMMPTEKNNLNIKPGSDNQFFVVFPNHSLTKPEFTQYHKNLIVFDSGTVPKYVRSYSNTIKDISAGLQSIFLALGFCEKVDVFGFGIDNKGIRGYYDYQKYPTRIFNNMGHQPDEQDKLIEQLAKQKQINLYMGNAQKAL